MFVSFLLKYYLSYWQAQLVLIVKLFHNNGTLTMEETCSGRSQHKLETFVKVKYLFSHLFHKYRVINTDFKTSLNNDKEKEYSEKDTQHCILTLICTIVEQYVYMDIGCCSLVVGFFRHVFLSVWVYYCTRSRKVNCTKLKKPSERITIVCWSGPINTNKPRKIENLKNCGILHC